MRKIFALSFIAILLISLTFSLIPTSHAQHNATVMWLDYRGTPYERKSYTIYRAPWTSGDIWLNFTVANHEDSIDPIYKLLLIIPNDGDGYAKYHFAQSIIWNHTGKIASGWTATPDEIDNGGNPRTVVFAADINPIMPNETFRFDIRYSSSTVATCKNEFHVYTIDKGTFSDVPVTREDATLYVITDPDRPVDPNMIHPLATEGTSEANPIIAIFNPYPTSWYMDLEFTVRDMLVSEGADHDTGVSRIEAYIAEYTGGTTTRVWYKDYPHDTYYWKEPQFANDPDLHITEKIRDLAKGRQPGTFKFHLTINVFDFARNKKPYDRDFWFKIPSYFLTSPARGTVGRFDNIQNSLGEWRGSISDTYEGLLGHYQLGTEVTVEGLEPLSPPTVGFTPNSRVNVYVQHPIQGAMLVLKNIPTDSRGRFKASFLFPKGPNGIYKVEAVDAKGITDFAWFEVLHGVIFMPDVVTGPAKVEVIASGLPVDAGVDAMSTSSRLNVDLFLIDGLDAILSVNKHVIDYWYVDAWGVLHSDMTEDDERGLPQQGFFMPVLESGKYLFEFRVPGQRWDKTVYRTARTEEMDYWKPSFTMQVATKFDEIKTLINGRLDTVDLKIKSVNDAVVKYGIDIGGAVGTIDGKVNDLGVKVTSVKTVADTISTKADTISTKVDDVKGATVTLQTTVKDLPGWTQTIHGWVKDINGDWATITTEVGDIKVDTTQLLEDIKPGVSTLSTPAMLTMVLSAIAAIAAIVSVIVVVRRLKVAA